MYSATKHGQRVFNEAVFHELKEHGIKCCAIGPGYVRTKMVAHVEKDDPHMMEPEDIAQAVEFVLDTSYRACPTNIVMRAQHAKL